MKIKPIVGNQHLHPILVSQDIDCDLTALDYWTAGSMSGPAVYHGKRFRGGGNRQCVAMRAGANRP